MDTTSELARDLRPLLVRLRLFAPSSPVAHTMFVWADVSSSRSTHPGRKALATGASKLGPGHVSWLAPCSDFCSMGVGTDQASRDGDWAAILAQLGISEGGVPKWRSELRWLFGRVRVSCCQIAVGCCIRAWYRQQALGSRDDLPQRGVTCLLQIFCESMTCQHLNFCHVPVRADFPTRCFRASRIEPSASGVTIHRLARMQATGKSSTSVLWSEAKASSSRPWAKMATRSLRGTITLWGSGKQETCGGWPPPATPWLEPRGSTLGALKMNS